MSGFGKFKLTDALPKHAKESLADGKHAQSGSAKGKKSDKTKSQKSPASQARTTPRKAT